MRDYTKIEAWRLADDLTVTVYDERDPFLRKRYTDKRANCGELLILFQRASFKAFAGR